MATWIKSRIYIAYAFIALVVIGIYIYIRNLHIKNKECETIKDINRKNNVILDNKELLQKAKDKYYEAIAYKEKSKKKDLDKDNSTRWLFILLLLFTACYPRVVYEYITVREDIPLMLTYQRPSLDIETPAPVEGVVVLDYSTLNAIYMHVQELHEVIDWYEHDIMNYMIFREVYNQ